MKRKTIKIPVPIAVTGQRVSVLNYRRKRMQIWEEGVVSSYEFSFRWSKDGYWTYSVRLDRPSPNNHTITLTVSDDQIKLLV